MLYTRSKQLYTFRYMATAKQRNAYISFAPERSQINERPDYPPLDSLPTRQPPTHSSSQPSTHLRLCNLHQRSYGPVTRRMPHTASSASHVCAVTRMHRCRRSRKRRLPAAVCDHEKNCKKKGRERSACEITGETRRKFLSLSFLLLPSGYSANHHV